MAPDIPTKPQSGIRQQRRRRHRPPTSVPETIPEPVPVSPQTIANEKQIRRLELMTKVHPDTWRFSLRTMNQLFSLDDKTLRHIYRLLSLGHSFALLTRVVDVWKDQGEASPLDLGAFGQTAGPSILVRQVVAGYLLATEHDRDMKCDEELNGSLPGVSKSLLRESREGLELMSGGE